MSWQYRVMKHESEHGPWFGIHEVYDTPHGWTEKPEAVISDEGIEGLRWHLTEMLKALDKPVLDFKTGKEVEYLHE